MKKFVCIIALVLLLGLTACNYNVIDTKYDFNYGYVALPNGDVVEGTVDSWRDYDGDQLQVTIDGVTYLSNSTRIVLVSGGDGNG